MNRLERALNLSKKVSEPTKNDLGNSPSKCETIYVKLVGIDEIEKNDWSLTPGRYVDVAREEVDEDFDFEEAMRAIHAEINELNAEAVELAERIAGNFEELGI